MDQHFKQFTSYNCLYYDGMKIVADITLRHPVVFTRTFSRPVLYRLPRGSGRDVFPPSAYVMLEVLHLQTRTYRLPLDIWTFLQTPQSELVNDNATVR